MTDLAKLVVTLEAQNAKYLKSLAQSEKRMKRFEGSTKKSLGNIKTLFAGLGSAVLFKGIIDATAEQESAVRQLEQGLITTGGVVGQSLDELRAKAAELQKITTFGDEEIIRAQSQLVTFTKITGQEFDKTIELAADLSTRFGTDLKSSVIQLGKALNDPVANLSALSRSGIQFTETQKDMIKQLVESNRLVDAQTIILKELETQFGGSAVAARDTFGGALTGLKNVLGDFLEGEGGLDSAKTSVEELTKTLEDPSVKSGIDVFITGTIGALAKFAEAVAFIATNTKKVAENLARLSGATSTVEDIDRRIGVLRASITSFIRFLDKPVVMRLGFDDDQVRQGIERMQKEIADLEQKRSILDGSALAGAAGTGASGATTNTGITKLDTATESAAGSLKVFQATLDKINNTAGTLTAENVQFSDLTRFTAEARTAQVGGDNAKALKLAEQGAKAVELLKESGKESTLVLSGALKKLDAIAAKATAGEADKKEEAPVVGILEIKGLGKEVSIQGDSNQIKDFVQQLTGALKAEAVAVSG